MKEDTFNVYIYNSNFKDLKDFELLNTKPEDFKANFKMENLILLYFNDYLQEYNKSHEASIMEGIPTLIFIHNYSETEFQSFLPLLEQLAKENRRNLQFLHGDSKSHFAKKFNRSFKLTPKELPVVCITSVNHALDQELVDKYRLAFKNKRPSYIEINDFIQGWLSKSLLRYLVSEDEPDEEFDQHGVKRFTSHSLFEMMESYNMIENIIYVCNERYDLCRKTKQIFLRVVKKLKNFEDIVFGEINPYLNEIDYLKFTHLPSFVFLPKKNKGDKKKFFRGVITTKNLIEFIKKHSKIFNPSKVIVLENEEALFKEEEEQKFKQKSIGFVDDDEEYDEMEDEHFDEEDFVEDDDDEEEADDNKNRMKDDL
jgi:thiol-disulfide isomerase/thioredoxin